MAIVRATRLICAGGVCLLSTASFAVGSTDFLPYSAPTIQVDTASKALSAFKKAAQKQPAIAKAIDKYRDSLAIIFVPGILGSKLEDPSGHGWGQAGIVDIATHYSDFLSGLALDPELIDETKAT